MRILSIVSSVAALAILPLVHDGPLLLSRTAAAPSITEYVIPRPGNFPHDPAVAKDGTEIWGHLVVTALEDAEGVAIVLVEDITDRAGQFLIADRDI